MKLLRFGKAGKMILLGNDSKSGSWYLIGDKVHPFLKNFREGDEIEIQTEKQNGTDVLTRIAKAGGGTPVVASSTATTTVASQKDSVPEKKPFVPYTGKSPAENDSIKRQAIMHATSRTLISRAGTLTPEALEAEIRSLYKLYSELVG